MWKHLSDKIFGEEGSRLRSDYICPKCGSSNWKFPNPLRPSEFLANPPIMINNTLFECRKCGYIGTFFAVDDAKKVQGKFNYKKTAEAEKPLISGFWSKLGGFAIIVIAWLFDFYIGAMLLKVYSAIINKFKR